MIKRDSKLEEDLNVTGLYHNFKTKNKVRFIFNR